MPINGLLGFLNSPLESQLGDLNSDTVQEIEIGGDDFHTFFGWAKKFLEIRSPENSPPLSAAASQSYEERERDRYVFSPMTTIRDMRRLTETLQGGHSSPRRPVEMFVYHHLTTLWGALFAKRRPRTFSSWQICSWISCDYPVDINVVLLCFAFKHSNVLKEEAVT